MGTIAKCLLESKYAENSQTTQYTSPTGTRAIIDKFVAYSAAGTTLAVNIVGSGGAAAASNLLVNRTLSAGETYTFPELVGQVLNAGDFVSTLASAASSVVIRISGRETT
jgi:hypothetical protein